MKRKGFTLVEMLAVIAILGILVLLVLPNVLKNYRDAKKIAFIDEAKAVYTQATDKYVTEKTKGNKIGLIEKDGTNETHPLALANAEDLSYTIRLDNNGQVTAFKLTNGELCIVGVGDFLGSYAKEDVLDLSDEEAKEKCAVTALNDNQKFILRLQNKTTVKTDHDPKMIYLKYNDGWYSDNNMHRKITNVTIPYKENNYYKGAWATNTIGSKIQAISCNGSIVPGPDGGGIFTGREEKPYVEAISRFEKKYYHVVFTGGESGSLTMEPCYYGASECHLPSNKDSNGYGKDIKKTGYLFTGWKDTKTNKIYADGASLPVLTDANENEEAYKAYKFDNTKVCSNGEDEGDTNKINFEAQWVPIKYKIAYDCNEGTGTMANTDHTYDVEVNLRVNTCKRSGYSFLGWSKTKTGSKDFDDNAKVKNLTTVHNSTVTLYAVWNACSAGTYLAGNTCTECAKDYYSAGTANASCTKCPTGYTTTGKGSSAKLACTINCAANKRVASVDAQCTTACEAGYNHDAHVVKGGETSSACSANKYTITFNSNNGSGQNMANIQMTYGVSKQLPANTYSRKGFIYNGWNTNANGTGNAYADKATVNNLTTTNNGTVTLYAQWKNNYNCPDRTVTLVGKVSTISKNSPYRIAVSDYVRNVYNELTYGSVPLSGYEYSEFGVGTHVKPSITGQASNDYAVWYVFAADADIYYAEKETTRESDLRPLSNVDWTIWGNKKTIYVYKLGCVKSPEQYTFVGEVHSAASWSVNHNHHLYAVDKAGNRKARVKQEGASLSGIDFTEFGIGYQIKPSTTVHAHGENDYAVWYLYAANDDIYYSEKETTNASDLKPLSTIDWQPHVMKKYYLYKKNTIYVPSNYTYVGEVNTAAAWNTNGQHYLYVIDKVGKRKVRVSQWGSVADGIEYPEFGIGYQIKPSITGQASNDYAVWYLYAANEDIYYSERDTTNAGELQPLSTIDWRPNAMKKYYLYKKNTISVPSNYTYVGEVHSAAASNVNSKHYLYIIDRVTNKKARVKQGNQVNYSGFGIGYRIKQSITGQASNNYPVWYLQSSNNNIYYSERDTTNAGELHPLSTIDWRPNAMKKYYLYRKK